VLLRKTPTYFRGVSSLASAGCPHDPDDPPFIWVEQFVDGKQYERIHGTLEDAIRLADELVKVVGQTQRMIRQVMKVPMPDIRTRAELAHAAKVALGAVHPADLTVVELTALVNLAESFVQVRRPVDEVGDVVYIAHDRITVTGHEASDPLGSRCHGIAVAAAYSAIPAHADQNGYLRR
jgi:hypothetical protein